MSRPVPSTRAREARSSTCCASSWTGTALTIVMVTHDPLAASRADGVLFLADGQIVDHLTSPTAEAVADRMTHLEG